MKKGFSLLPIVVILGIFGLVVVGVAYYSSGVHTTPSANNEAVTSEGSPYQPAKSQAQVKNATISLEGAQPTAGGQSVPVTVSFSSNQEPVSGVALRLVYDGNQADGLSVSGITVSPSLVGSGNWNCPITLSSVNNGQVTVDLGCVNLSPQGFSASGITELATFALNRASGKFNGPVQMTIDPKLSAIVRKSDGKNVLNISGELVAQ